MYIFCATTKMAIVISAFYFFLYKQSLHTNAKILQTEQRIEIEQKKAEITKYGIQKHVSSLLGRKGGKESVVPKVVA